MKKMKRTRIILCALAAGFLGAGCDDDAQEAAFGILEARLNFDAPASRGYVLVSDPSCTATAADGWCTVSRSGDSIIVNVTDNISIESRHTSLTLASGGASRRIPVSQSGGYFRLESDSVQHTGDSTATLNLAVPAAFDYEAIPSAAWVTCTRDGQTLRLAVERNLSGAPRKADISLSCPTMGKDFHVSLLQYSVDDLMGSWEASYTTNSGQEQTAQVTLTHNAADGTVSLSGLDRNYEDITLKADADGQRFSFATGTFIGFLERGGTTYRIYQHGATGTHEVRPGETRTLHYGSLFSISEGGKETLTFQADSTFTDGTAMEGIAVMADMNGQLRSVSEYYGLQLTR